jgi:hypothetical protein
MQHDIYPVNPEELENIYYSASEQLLSGVDMNLAVQLVQASAPSGAAPTNTVSILPVLHSLS